MSLGLSDTSTVTEKAPATSDAEALDDAAEATVSPTKTETTAAGKD